MPPKRCVCVCVCCVVCRAMGLQSLPVAFGVDTAKWICVSSIDVTQLGVALYLWQGLDQPTYAAVLLGLILPQIYFQFKFFLPDPIANDVKYQVRFLPIEQHSCARNLGVTVGVCKVPFVIRGRVRTSSCLGMGNNAPVAWPRVIRVLCSCMCLLCRHQRSPSLSSAF